MERVLIGRPVVAGSAAGLAVVSKQPISFWGGVSPRTGEVIDRRHDCSGTILAGKVFVFPEEKGSSTASAVLMESIKARVAPAACINVRVAPILALGSIVADEMYGEAMPIVVLSQEDLDSISDGDYLVVEPDGTVRVCCSRAAQWG